MSLDPTTTDAATGWTLCTLEDASSPGQEFPCMWNAQTEGNGQGCSFVLDFADDVPHYVTDVLVDGSILTDDAGCAPYAGDEGFDQLVSPANAEPVALTVQNPVPQPAGLAHTGTDPLGWAVAAVLLMAGIGLVRVRLHYSC